MKTELTADAVVRRISALCEFTDCGARTISQKVEPLIRLFEADIRAQCEAARGLVKDVLTEEDSNV